MVIGLKVVTASKLTSCIETTYVDRGLLEMRRTNESGVITDIVWAERKLSNVTHDDGTKAVYTENELAEK